MTVSGDVNVITLSNVPARQYFKAVSIASLSSMTNTVP
jgi:hypothetical protein